MQPTGFFLVLILACLAVVASGATRKSDVIGLSDLYLTLESPSQLTRWSEDRKGDPCGQHWKGVICDEDAVIELHLPSQGLRGQLSHTLDEMGLLTTLDLSNNAIGGEIPYYFPRSLLRLDLSGNALAGWVPATIGELSSIQYLSLRNNQLEGVLGEIFTNIGFLETLDLSENSFEGEIPKTVADLTKLTALYLNGNAFVGTIDVLASDKIPLQYLNVANNFFTGKIPDRLKSIKSLVTGGNHWSLEATPSRPSSTTPAKGTRGQGSTSNTGGNGENLV